jgi:septal ring factor EnvC (AmiA/AmiB activator)
MSGDYGTCSECGAPLQLGERRMCSPCWVAYWNAQLESVPVERLMSPEQAHLEQVGNELILIVANLNEQLKLAEQTIAQQEQTIRLQQEHIDALSEDLAEQSRYLGVVCDMLNQEQQLTDGLIQRNNELAAELMDAKKRNGHLVR